VCACAGAAPVRVCSDLFQRYYPQFLTLFFCLPTHTFSDLEGVRTVMTFSSNLIRYFSKRYMIIVFLFTQLIFYPVWTGVQMYSLMN
jgi:hypothetical protein